MYSIERTNDAKYPFNVVNPHGEDPVPCGNEKEAQRLCDVMNIALYRKRHDRMVAAQ
jgi:hypothetical protein